MKVYTAQELVQELRSAARLLQGESDRIAHRAKVLKEKSQSFARAASELEIEIMNKSKVSETQDVVVYN